MSFWTSRSLGADTVVTRFMRQAASHGPSLATRSFERVLIIKPSSLGDIIHALPALHLLRTRFPDASISWLVAEPFAPIIANHPDLNDTIIFERDRFGAVGTRMEPTAAFVEFVRKLNKRRFDLAVDLQGLFRSGFLALATGARARIGFAAAREMAWMFYSHRVHVDDPDTHAVDRNMGIGPILGCPSAPPVFDLALTTQERRNAVDLLTQAGLASGDRFVAVLPGARWETKRWAPSRFSATIDAVMEQCGVSSVLLGAPDERAICDTIAGSTRTRTINLAGRTGLRDLVAIIKRASVVVAHDSAPMHIAVALGRPVVAILGPTNRLRTGPYGELDSVVQHDRACVPCYLKHLSQCPYDHDCMNSIDVTTVADRVRQRLSATAADGSSPLHNPTVVENRR